LANGIKTASGITNTEIISNIIDTSLFGFAPKIKQNKTTLYFTCAAHWESPKRLDLIIDSVSEFAKKTRQSIELNVIGNGSQQNRYVNKSNNSIQIHWLGYLPKHEIPAVLHKTDYFLHASAIETFSIVIVEALSTGTPVLASNAGAIPELIDTSNGILVENTLESWISGLTEITNRNFDHPAIAAKISGKYSPAAIAEKIENVYEHILTPAH
jgi:glycosyltransferase involved in cell wall biosynthesis